jgi:hypothetical protein
MKNDDASKSVMLPPFYPRLIQISAVPWIGFPVGYAVSGILLTVFGYFAMILAQ